VDEMETKLADVKGSLFIKNKIARKTWKLIDKL
jgi:hypothetical protein